MPQLISAYVIYNAATGTYYGDNMPQISINCYDLQAFSPKFGWLKRQLSMGVGGGSIIQYTPTFDSDDPEIFGLPNTLRGVFIQQGGTLVMIDAITSVNVVATCDSCCDSNNAVTQYYTSGVPDFVSPVSTLYTIQRTDAGTPSAFDLFSMDYMNQSVLDPVFVSRNSGAGTTRYSLSSFGTPILVGTDTLV